MVAAEVVAHRVRLVVQELHPRRAARVVVGERGGGAGVAPRLGARAAAHGRDAIHGPREAGGSRESLARTAIPRDPTRILFAMSPEGLPPPPPPPPRGSGGRGLPGQGMPRWGLWALLGLTLSVLFLGPLLGGAGDPDADLLRRLHDLGARRRRGRASRSTTPTARSRAQLTDDAGGDEFRTTGPLEGGIPEADLTAMRENDVDVEYTTPSPNWFISLLPFLLPMVILVGFFWFMQRRAQSQMGGIMSIGRSKAKTYSTERPGTTFADVAGYDGVKQDIKEVVDFLKTPERFAEIGARIPKGVLLVGPPGHRQDPHRPGGGRRGRRAVPVGHRLRLHGDVRGRRRQPRPRPVPERPQDGPGDHLRRRDRLDRPQARRRPRRRPRRAGADAQPDALGDGRLRGHRGHRDDRRPPTGPTSSTPPCCAPAASTARWWSRCPSSASARRSCGCTPSRSAWPPTSTSRSWPAARPACPAPTWPTSSTRPRCSRCAPATRRSTSTTSSMARDRVLMGARRESMALADREKEAIAYHEAGHAVAAAVLPQADPVHKVTILPMGMALGVTQQLPMDDRHIYRQDYIEDSLVRPHGRPHRRGARVRRDLHRRQQRPRRLHRARPQDGARVGHVRSRRPDGLGLAGRRVPRRRPHALPRLLRRDGPGDRRGGRAHPARAGGALPRHPHRAPRSASTSWPARCSSTRRSTAPRSTASSPSAARVAPPSRSSASGAPSDGRGEGSGSFSADARCTPAPTRKPE